MIRPLLVGNRILRLTNQRGIEEIIGYIETIQPLLNKTKDELRGYLEYLRQGGFEMKTDGFDIKGQIKVYENVLDKYNEVVKRRVEINKKGEELKKNIEEMNNRVNKMLGMSKKEEMEEVHDELIFKLME